MEKLSIPELSALLSTQIQSLGPDHPDTLATRHVLARRIAERDGYEQAVPLYEQLVADRSRVLGERHRDTLTSQHNLALCLASCHRLDESRTIFENLIRTLEETFGKEDDDVIRTRQWYLNDVISKLEPFEILEKEYAKLFTIISAAGKRRINRNRWIREQFEQHVKLHGDSSSDEKMELQDESKSSGRDPVGTKSRAPTTYEPQLQSWMAKMVWGELSGDLEHWQSLIASDARAIAQSVTTREESAIETLLFERFPMARRSTPDERQFEVLHRLIERESSKSLRVANRLARAYVDFAHFALHVSNSASETAEATIDALRLSLRSILGQNLDATSDAEIDFERSFQHIVGLENVKRELMGFVRVLLHNRRELARGGTAEPPRLHLAFVGSPGTGKTTVARLYGRLLFQLGLLESDKFTEIDKSSLVNEHTGDVEHSTRKLIERATPGVLFIDEAYSFNDPYSNVKGMGQRALEVIIKGMEDNRASLAVILAGYSKEMEDLMKVNPGLPSRIAATIEFSNYSITELIEIAHRSASKRGLRLDTSAESRMRDVIVKLLPKDDFGNAREVESLIEEAQRNLLTRIAPLDDLATTEEQCLIREEDVPVRESPSGKRVGFFP